MSFNWSDYHIVAKELNALACSGSRAEVEALHRSSISRHYYAMHHIALDYAIKNLDYTAPSGNTKHAHLRDYYLGYPDDKGTNISYELIRNIGGDLKTALTFRVQADYLPSVGRVNHINNQVEKRTERVLKFIG